MRKIGVLGGTFNPIHNGHINLALKSCEILSLDKLFIVPSYISPHKRNIKIIDSNLRYIMCKLAVDKYPKIEVSNIEISQKKVSYTYETLKYFKKVFPLSTIYLIMGADAFMSIETWKNSQEIFKDAILCAVPRNNINIEVLKEYSQKIIKLGAKTKILDMPINSVSSTMIRKKIKQNEDISNFMPKGVEKFL